MKKVCKFAVLLLSFCALELCGQLTVTLRFNRSNYMLYEHIYACVSIRNDSGKPLIFGSRPELQGFILFDVRDQKNRLIPRRKGQEFSAKGLYIAPGEIKNLVIPLDKYYDFSKEGAFFAHVYISHNSIRRLLVWKYCCNIFVVPVGYGPQIAIVYPAACFGDLEHHRRLLLCSDHKRLSSRYKRKPGSYKRGCQYKSR